MRLRASRGTTQGTLWEAQWPERQQRIVEGVVDVIRDPVKKNDVESKCLSTMRVTNMG